jgi:uncharacterized membrane protein YqgA involved in biofilm formation
MTGTLINAAAVLIGGSLGLLFGARLPDRLKTTVISGMGLFTAALGVQMFLKTGNPLIVLGSVIIGALLGEWWRIEEGLERVGEYLERRFAGGPRPLAPAAGASPSSIPAPPVLAGGTKRDAGQSRFVRGFMIASLLFCVGPLTILGSIQDGLTGDYTLLAVKSVLDGFAALAFASTLGVGVLFSALTILVYQGGISLLAGRLTAGLDPLSISANPMVTEMTAVGGVILLGLAISSLLELKRIRVGNFLPALAVAPLLVWVVSLFQR